MSVRTFNFNPLSPHGERPSICSRSACDGHDFNPLSPHGERRGRPRRYPLVAISIHSPRMGRDSEPCGLCAFNPLSYSRVAISIHSPRMGRDTIPAVNGELLTNFNPLSPHGERLSCSLAGDTVSTISIHSPRMGRDIQKPPMATPPHGETQLARVGDLAISIHSPRMGRDQTSWEEVRAMQEISIHSPRMGRDLTQVNFFGIIFDISIHSPRMGRDPILMMLNANPDYFNPLSPHGERLWSRR